MHHLKIIYIPQFTLIMKLNSTFYIEKFCTRGMKRKIWHVANSFQIQKYSAGNIILYVSMRLSCVNTQWLHYFSDDAAIFLNIVSCEYVIDSKRLRYTLLNDITFFTILDKNFSTLECWSNLMLHSWCFLCQEGSSLMRL